LVGCANPSFEPEDDALEALLRRDPATVEEIKQDIAEERLAVADVKLADLLRDQPDNYEAAFLHGEVLLQLNRDEEAMARFTLAGQSEELRAEALQGLGLALLRVAGPHESARVNLDEATSLDPTLWRSHNALGQIYDSDKMWAEAQEAYAKAIDLRPDSAMLFNNLGMSFLLQRRFDDSVDTFRRALELDPALTVARSNLRMAYALQGKYVNALAGVPDVDLPDALNNVGYAAMVRGDFDAAEAYLTRALELSPAYHRRAAANLKRLEEMRVLSAEEKQ
jgi:Flp pilus assembly protein TadD